MHSRIYQKLGRQINLIMYDARAYTHTHTHTHLYSCARRHSQLEFNGTLRLPGLYRHLARVSRSQIIR